MAYNYWHNKEYTTTKFTSTRNIQPPAECIQVVQGKSYPVNNPSERKNIWRQLISSLMERPENSGDYDYTHPLGSTTQTPHYTVWGEYDISQKDGGMCCADP